jgi:hypothetical protein|nr:MAG TPA: Tethering Ubl4a to BAGS domain [Caudoviricetes sp.]
MDYVNRQSVFTILQKYYSGQNLIDKFDRTIIEFNQRLGEMTEREILDYARNH